MPSTAYKMPLPKPSSKNKKPIKKPKLEEFSVVATLQMEGVVDSSAQTADKALKEANDKAQELLLNLKMLTSKPIPKDPATGMVGFQVPVMSTTDARYSVKAYTANEARDLVAEQVRAMFKAVDLLIKVAPN